MRRVVLSDYAMLDPAIYREVLGEETTVTEAQMGSTTALVDVAGDADAVVTDVRTPVTAAALAALPDLEVVVRSAVGIGNIDVAAAADAGVDVVHVPEYCTDEVASHALALLLTCVRSLPTYDDAVREGRWTWEDGRPIRRLRDRTVGLVSFGPIARRLAELLSGFDATLVAYDPYVDAETMTEYDVEKVPLDGLFERADHVSVHAPLTDETRGMVDASCLAYLDEKSVLVNTGRGAVVDEDVLVAALDAGGLKAAGLDVLGEEPPPADHPLVGRDDVVVTPHAGWYSEDARDIVNRRGATYLRDALAGEEPEGMVEPDADWL